MRLGGTDSTHLQHRLEGGIEAYALTSPGEGSKTALMREKPGHSYRPGIPSGRSSQRTCNIVARNVNGRWKLETVPVVELDCSRPLTDSQGGAMKIGVQKYNPSVDAEPYFGAYRSSTPGT